MGWRSRTQPGCCLSVGRSLKTPTAPFPLILRASARAVWRNISLVLATAGMTVAHLVKVTTYLTHQEQAAANGLIRREVLGSVRPALTVVVVQTLESQWLLEIDAIAAG